MPGYAVGSCNSLESRGLSYVPAPGQTINLGVWLFWLGAEKQITYPATVTNPPRPPECSLTGAPAEGAAPLDVHLVEEVSDPDGGELTLHWDFGDEWDVVGGLEQDHTCAWHGTYLAVFLGQ